MLVNLEREIELLLRLRHRNVLLVFDFFAERDFVYIVTELCDGGDLAQLIKKRRQLSLSEARTYLQQLGSALRCLRANNIAHLDLKPSNLLLRRRAPPHQPVLVVADFGFAVQMGEHSLHESIRGSPLYLAPEMWREGSYDAR